MQHEIESLWLMADRSGQKEYRCDCPYCSKQKGDKTLSLNTEKRVGICHRCNWKLSGKPTKHFTTRNVHELDREREKRAFRFAKIAEVCQAIAREDIATQYICNRLGVRPITLPRLGFAPELRYYTGLDNYKTTPAMVGALQDVTGRTTGFHITYLSVDGLKAFGNDSRRYCKLRSLAGSAIRLYPATDSLIVAEGIETALALQLCTNDPVWATTSAALLKAFEPPPGVTNLLIAGDNDSNGVGQRAAWALHQRLKSRLEVSVLIPERENSDWLDQLRNS